MRRDQPGWQTENGNRARKTVAQIEASIVALNPEDLLDLYDIFADAPEGVLSKLATNEMRRRGL